MAEETDEIEVLVEGEAADPKTEPKVEVKAPQEKPQEAPKAIEPEEGIQALKEKLERERQARTEAERRRAEAEASAHRAAEEAQGSNVALVTNAIELVKQRGESLKAKYAEAMSNQDYVAAADVQLEMATVATDLRQLEQGKQALENAPKREAKPEPTVDRVEHLASQMTARSAAWVRQHPEFARDDKKYAAMLGAHNLAVNAYGLEPDTDEYFAAVETALRIREPEIRQEVETKPEPAPRRQAPPAAPVSRSADPVNPRPNAVRLTREEVEMAQAMDMTPEQYARQKLALQREGKLH